MSIFHVITMVGGLALFLYGMHILGEGLSKLSGGRLEAVLEKMTDHPLKGVLLGAAVTAVIQSSSATTVMVVGFVNSGIMQLRQAVGIIMGANVGTTVTSWILSLSGLESDHIFVRMLKPENFAPLLAMTGVIFLMFRKTERKTVRGNILLGFAILMMGMDTMSSAVKPLRDVPEFTGMFASFSHPVAGMTAGTVLTAVIQSSSASVGILQALCSTGAVPYSAVLPIIMGQNIGTCVTALLSSVGASTNARRAAFLHLYFNLIGTVVFMAGFYVLHYFVPFGFLEQPATAFGIAFVHSCFNIASTVILLPFTGGLVKLACISISGKKEDAVGELPKELEALSNMDKRFLDNPSFALRQCRKTAQAMLALACGTFRGALELLFDYSEERVERVKKLEDYVDRYEEAIIDYMFHLGLNPLSEADVKELSVMQHSVGNMERIADYSLGIAINRSKMEIKELEFSKEAEEELRGCGEIVLELMRHIIVYWEEADTLAADSALQLEMELSRNKRKIMKNHRERLKRGNCSVDLGFLLADILLGFEKAAEHCIRIADDAYTVSSE